MPLFCCCFVAVRIHENRIEGIGGFEGKWMWGGWGIECEFHHMEIKLLKSESIMEKFDRARKIHHPWTKTP